MIFDKEGLFSDAQSVTASAASENYIDLGEVKTPVGGVAPLERDMGKGSKVDLRIQCVEAFATLTSLEIQVQVANNPAFTSAKTVATTGAVPRADLVAGYIAPILYLPRGTNERYVRLNYVVTGSNATAGKITAGTVAGNSDD